MPIKISIANNSAAFAVQNLKSKTRGLPKAIAKATLYMERETKLNFAKQSDPDGKPWAALKPSTLARKKTNAILRETATLANSITSSSAGLIGQVSASTEYGIYHQTGTRKMAQRKIIGISESRHVPKIKQIISDQLGF